MQPADEPLESPSCARGVRYVCARSVSVPTGNGGTATCPTSAAVQTLLATSGVTYPPLYVASWSAPPDCPYHGESNC